MPGRLRPARDGTRFVVAADQHVLRMRRADLSDARLEILVVDAAASRHQRGLLIGDAGQPHAHRQRRPPMLRAEGVEVRGEGGGAHKSPSSACRSACEARQYPRSIVAHLAVVAPSFPCY